MGLGKKVFIRKSGANGARLYKWSPDDTTKKARKKDGNFKTKYYCSTPIGSQGNDLVVTYTYNVVIVGGQVTKAAYVQCDYVT